MLPSEQTIVSYGCKRVLKCGNGYHKASNLMAMHNGVRCEIPLHQLYVAYIVPFSPISVF